MRCAVVMEPAAMASMARGCAHAIPTRWKATGQGLRVSVAQRVTMVSHARISAPVLPLASAARVVLGTGAAPVTPAGAATVARCATLMSSSTALRQLPAPAPLTILVTDMETALLLRVPSLDNVLAFRPMQHPIAARSALEMAAPATAHAARAGLATASARAIPDSHTQAVQPASQGTGGQLAATSALGASQTPARGAGPVTPLPAPASAISAGEARTATSPAHKPPSVTRRLSARTTEFVLALMRTVSATKARLSATLGAPPAAPATVAMVVLTAQSPAP